MFENLNVLDKNKDLSEDINTATEELKDEDDTENFLFFIGGDEDRDKPKRDAAKHKLYGVEQIQLTPPSATPSIRVEIVDNKEVVHICYFEYSDISKYGEHLRMNHHVIQMLDHANKNTEFRIYLDSPGGAVTVAANVISAMRRTKGHVRTIAVGRCMSAAALIWCNGHSRLIFPSAVFMFHFSSHGSYGNSKQVAKSSEAIVNYMKNDFLNPILEEKLLTQDEYDLVSTGEDVFIDAFTMEKRLRELGTESLIDPFYSVGQEHFDYDFSISESLDTLSTEGES